ncbi:unnamed protein product [Didymodactylos carnosus]|uniref:Uncharacterized protein n=1 Tax=Didymodactylos carnosus TaxID=1234261 RepID=A0A815P8H6_9BILA|nr:unnamed protein product [Didymodactylos carnosus]CAF4320306.1 unnamed protein product [Didymodactylos carnosus]
MSSTFLMKDRQVDSIFIFSHSDLDRPDESVRLRYVKVIDIYTEIHLLREAIRKDINRIEKSLAEFSFYQKEKSFTDLTAESGSFLFFQLCKSALFSMEKTDESKQEMLSECRLYYHGIKEELDNIEEFNTKYKAEKAIYWYTKECFLYKLVNRAFRKENIPLLYTLRFYITDLSNALEMKFKKWKSKEENARSILKVYRGLKLTTDERSNIQKNIGNLISSNGYWSTTPMRNKALDFAKNSKRPNAQAVLLEITMDVNLVEKTILVDIADESEFEEEKEVLFDLAKPLYRAIRRDKVPCGGLTWRLDLIPIEI